MNQQPALLQVTDISKHFAGVTALEHVSLTVQPGEISCLVGENGSGKSTLIKIIAGVYAPDSGTITIRGKQYTHLRPIDAIHEGVQVIYQDFSLFPNLTVAENIALNDQLARGRRLVNWREVYTFAREALDRIQVDLPLRASVDRLPVAQKQLVAISRAILQNAGLIIMDEPTTALTEKEVEALFGVIRQLQGRGITTLFVSHKLNEVLAIAERIIVLRNGEKVLDSGTSGLDHARIAYHMTGREVSGAGYHDYTPPGDGAPPLLRVERLSLPGSFTDISFEVYPGEVVGVTGLLGSGRTELALALFGVRPAETGAIFVNGKPARIRTIQDAIRHSIGYVPEDRLTEGLFLEQPISNNVIVRVIDQLLSRLGFIRPRARQAKVQTLVSELRIKTADPSLPAKSLSGGNQQRVVLAKWLASAPRLLILNGPTMGVDVGSKAELHETIRGLARQGLGVLIISDDIPEIMQTCNRVLLMRRGRLAGQYVTRDLTEQELATRLTADVA
jgi:simple sugar transport system ATP-binding protein